MRSIWFTGGVHVGRDTSAAARAMMLLPFPNKMRKAAESVELFFLLQRCSVKVAKAVAVYAWSQEARRDDTRCIG